MPKPSDLRALPSRLYVICDADVCQRAGWTLVDFASACLDGGARLLQVRAKHASSAWLLECAARIVERASAAGAAEVIINDRADVAQLAGAAGVHVGQEDLSPRAVRDILGDAAVVGLSTHTRGQIERALVEPVSHIALGPLFGTVTKDTGHAPVGLERLRLAADLASTHGLPLVAIGGMTIERARSAIDHGASAVAVISDLLATGNPAARVREYLDVLSRI